MELAPEKKLEDMLHNYLKENQGKAFTIVALRKRFETFTLDPQTKEYSRKNLQIILNNMRDNGKIKLTQREGKSYFFVPEIFKSTQDETKTQSFVPEKFISAETDRKKIKKKYCKRCKKEVILQKRKSEQKVYLFTSTFDPRNIEARRNTGWFCPDCGEKLAELDRKVKIIVYLSCVIFTGYLITSIFFTGGELQMSMFVLAIFFSVFTILITVQQMIKWVLKKTGRKIFNKLKDEPKEYFDRYMKKSN